MPGGTEETSATNRDLKDPGVVILTTFPFNSPIWPMQKTVGSWRIMVDYHKLNEVVTPITAAVPAVVSLLEQINASPGTWCAVIDLSNAFFPQYLLRRPTRSCLILAGQVSNTPSLSYLSGTSTQQS